MQKREHLNPELQNAYDYLRLKKKIKNQADVASKTGYSKQVTGKYLGGKLKASEDFLTTFERCYKLKLADYPVPFTGDASLAGKRELQEYTVTTFTKLQETQLQSYSMLELILKKLHDMENEVKNLKAEIKKINENPKKKKVS